MRFTTIKALVAVYVGVALTGIGFTLLFRDNPQLVNQAVWIRDWGMLGSAVVLAVGTHFASRGGSRSLLRLRLASVIIPVAIVVLIALPDPFPVWMKVQQAAGALAMVGVAILAFQRQPSVS